jgi:hypothetical protein
MATHLWNVFVIFGIHCPNVSCASQLYRRAGERQQRSSITLNQPLLLQGDGANDITPFESLDPYSSIPRVVENCGRVCHPARFQSL